MANKNTSKAKLANTWAWRVVMAYGPTYRVRLVEHDSDGNPTILVTDPAAAYGTSPKELRAAQAKIDAAYDLPTLHLKDNGQLVELNRRIGR